MGKLIGYCGLNCAECGAYLATKNNDQALREKTASEFAEHLGLNYKPEEMICTGCKSGGTLLPHCSDCGVRKCAMEKGIELCSACADFKTCEMIKEFIE